MGDFNGYGYFYVRLYWTGFGLNANIVEEYVLLAALLHVFVALKRTADFNIKQPVTSGALNMAISGVVLLSYMIVHLFQFRFGDTQPYKLRPPPLMINFEGINPFSDSFLHLKFVTSTSWNTTCSRTGAGCGTTCSRCLCSRPTSGSDGRRLFRRRSSASPRPCSST